MYFSILYDFNLYFNSRFTSRIININNALSIQKKVFPPSIPQILGLMVIRKMLDMVFSQHDLAWLDDILPDKKKKKKEEKKNTKKDKKKGKGGNDSEEVSVLVVRCRLLAL